MIINARDAIEASKTLHNERRIILATTLSKASDLEAFGFVPKANTKYVKISISDTGKGMSAEVQEHIFEPFYTTKELNRGTGLGLATVYGIVSQNNGFIHLDSAPEKGSIFHIFWPESTKKISEIKQSEPVQTALSSHHGHILVVEDEAAVRDFTHSALEAIGYRVTIAENGIQALNLLKKENDFDLVLTDLIMPEMNGQELADRMKKLKIEKPVLFVSGYTFDHLQKEGKIEGEINFLKKPFSVQGLANKISAVLNNKHA
jgi:CheY-like chemotaxis protein